MKFSIIVCLSSLVGCAEYSNSTTNPPIVDAGPRPIHDPDASIDASMDVGNKNICCQIIVNEVDSSVWNNGIYQCDNPTELPWVCNNNSSTPVACDDPSCVPGVSTCLGVNGTGVVIICN